jgi:hypothetical protein
VGTQSRGCSTASAGSKGYRRGVWDGCPEALRSQFAAAGISSIEIRSLDGSARFPSIEAWMHTDVTGWTLADLIDDAQYSSLRQAAKTELATFVQADGRGGLPPRAHRYRGQALNTTRYPKDARKPARQGGGLGRNRRDLIGTIREVLRIMARAQAATHLYTQLRPRYYADLAKRGLRRTDLPRAAYDALTREI